MSKKKFTDGLESIFGVSPEEDLTLNDDSVLLVETQEEVKVEERPLIRRKRLVKRSSKNFTSDLDSLFEDALQETLEEKAQKVIKDKTKVAPKRQRSNTKPLTGLDALIRRTVETSVDVEKGVRKRVTFVFEKDKLQRLKKIAREKNVYLKDIIGDVMSKYIEEYQEKNGHSDIDSIL